jgi:hypothetical protein
MALVLHGVTGGWDELLIALVAFGVLWIAVKLAGRKPVNEDETEGDSDSEDALGVDPEQPEHKDPAHPPAPNLTETTKSG